jgi:hypothetical protein
MLQDGRNSIYRSVGGRPAGTCTVALVGFLGHGLLRTQCSWHAWGDQLTEGSHAKFSVAAQRRLIDLKDVRRCTVSPR